MNQQEKKNRLIEIDQELEELHFKLENVQGTETEVYSRVVGYYRTVGNWNKGKREEYNHRITYHIDNIEVK